MDLTRLLALLAQVPALVARLRALGIPLSAVVAILRAAADILEKLDAANPPAGAVKGA